MNGSCMCWDHSLEGLSLLTYTIEYVDILSSIVCILTLLVIVCYPVITIISPISIIPLSLHHFRTSFSYTNLLITYQTTNHSISILNIILSSPLQLITSYYHIFSYYSSSSLHKHSYYHSPSTIQHSHIIPIHYLRIIQSITSSLHSLIYILHTTQQHIY